MGKIPTKPKGKLAKVEKVLTWEEQFPMRWYCISCSSAAECRVALQLRKYCQMLGWDHLYDSYLIPQEIVLTINAGGEKVAKRERLFAGYLLVRVRLTPDLRDLIVSTGGVMAIIGDRTGVTPIPIPDSQIQKVVAMMIEAEANNSGIRRKPRIEPGTKVVISHGSFQNFTGIVDSHEGRHVFVKVNIFGRETKGCFDEEIVISEEQLLTSSISIG